VVGCPEVVLLDVAALLRSLNSEPVEDSVLADNAKGLAAEVLSVLQEFLGSEALLDARLVLLTRGALAVGDGEAPSLVQAALTGLMRSAHTEHPGRFSLIDMDPREDPQDTTWQDTLHNALLSEEP
jgi:hypothetical protein